MKKGRRVAIDRKRLYVAIAGVVIIVIIVASFAYYWQSRTNALRIIDFSKRGPSQVPDMVIYSFVLRVANQGVNDVSDWTAVVKVLGNGSELARDSHAMRPLYSGQEVEDDEFGAILNTTDTADKILTFVATVEINGTILHQASISE